MTARGVAATTAGTVEGLDVDGVLSFLGIPYGDDVSGTHRFRAPRPPRPWTGVRPAFDLGPIAPQPVRPGGAARHGGAPMREDCLVLNVWTRSRQGKRPVLVWLHGGGFFQGSGFSPWTDGTALAAGRDVVVVSVNHRLSMLGFLHLDELGGAEWGAAPNPGLLDLVAALEWVRDNAAAFGGDPGNVTVFGHSGGGGKVSALLASPSARGLFHRAGIHGGPPFGLKDSGRATLIAQEVLHHLGVRKADPDVLGSVPLERLMEVQSLLGVGSVPTEHGMRFAPVAGTASLPAFPEEAFAAGAVSVPLLTGTALDELRYILLLDPPWARPGHDLDEATLTRLVAAGVDDPGDAPQLLERYRALGDPGRNADLLLTVLSDQFRIRTKRLAHLATGPVFSYLCDANQDSPLGAFHGIEMPLFFGNVGRGAHPLTGEGYDRAADVATRALVSFARTGNPGWPASTPERPVQFRFGDTGFEAGPETRPERLAVWQGITTSTRVDPWGRAFGSLA
ncbi:carboxylesterase family protein [Amycolatopsis endophytica]